MIMPPGQHGWAASSRRPHRPCGKIRGAALCTSRSRDIWRPIPLFSHGVPTDSVPRTRCTDVRPILLAMSLDACPHDALYARQRHPSEAPHVEYFNARALAAAGCSDRGPFPDSGRGARPTGNRSARPTRKAQFRGPFLAVVHCHSRSLRTKLERLWLGRASTATLRWRTSLRPRR
jgi:hypothetical protein